jgi:phosphatidylglycerophosphatase A
MASKSASAADRFALILGSCGGVGMAPRGPATLGATVGSVAYALIAPGPVVGVLMIVAATLAGAWASQRIIDLTGDRDPQIVVIDELAGVWVVMTVLPVGWMWLPVAVVVFRFFDKFKFGLAKRCDERHDGLGVMLDDLVAGGYAAVVIKLGLMIHGAFLR